MSSSTVINPSSTLASAAATLPTPSNDSSGIQSPKSSSPKATSTASPSPSSSVTSTSAASSSSVTSTSAASSSSASASKESTLAPAASSSPSPAPVESASTTSPVAQPENSTATELSDEQSGVVLPAQTSSIPFEPTNTANASLSSSSAASSVSSPSPTATTPAVSTRSSAHSRRSASKQTTIASCISQDQFDQLAYNLLQAMSQHECSLPLCELLSPDHSQPLVSAASSVYHYSSTAPSLASAVASRSSTARFRLVALPATHPLHGLVLSLPLQWCRRLCDDDGDDDEADDDDDDQTATQPSSTALATPTSTDHQTSTSLFASSVSSSSSSAPSSSSPPSTISSSSSSSSSFSSSSSSSSSVSNNTDHPPNVSLSSSSSPSASSLIASSSPAISSSTLPSSPAKLAATATSASAVAALLAVDPLLRSRCYAFTEPAGPEAQAKAAFLPAAQPLSATRLGDLPQPPLYEVDERQLLLAAASYVLSADISPSSASEVSCSSAASTSLDAVSSFDPSSSSSSSYRSAPAEEATVYSVDGSYAAAATGIAPAYAEPSVSTVTAPVGGAADSVLPANYSLPHVGTGYLEKVSVAHSVSASDGGYYTYAYQQHPTQEQTVSYQQATLPMKHEGTSQQPLHLQVPSNTYREKRKRASVDDVANHYSLTDPIPSIRSAKQGSPLSLSNEEDLLKTLQNITKTVPSVITANHLQARRLVRKFKLRQEKRKRQWEPFNVDALLRKMIKSGPPLESRRFTSYFTVEEIQEMRSPSLADLSDGAHSDPEFNTRHSNALQQSQPTPTSASLATSSSGSARPLPSSTASSVTLISSSSSSATPSSSLRPMADTKTSSPAVVIRAPNYDPLEPCESTAARTHIVLERVL
eukprot:CAMPEP_0174247060 /NCGR_PEP_ID=MMETSP0417-20130205/42377_1 /TAXON_ID=242541 /ORGANISM="Mayorella sp, Strain BSH-02190019" /LENGTH=874 /DNA_ID=CAMNT_0015326913 /DNA_START=190 /DNA_END=2811 /DNA_ORIENTATION=+